MKIYLAGKVAKDDWRHSIVGGLRGGVDFGDENAPWPVMERSIWGVHDYVGPYFISDDHGCAHGANTHGQGLDGNPCIEGFLRHATRRRGFVLEQCKQAIEAADLVFAWIEDVTAYGTLCEIGYAHALGKEIWVASPTYLPDLWFAYQMARAALFAINDPADALRIAAERRQASRILAGV